MADSTDPVSKHTALAPKRMSVRTVLLLVLVCVLTLILLTGNALGLLAGGKTPASSFRNAPDATATASANDIEYMPVAPGALDIQDKWDLPYVWKGVSYGTNMGVEDIVHYYKSELSARGWTLVFDNRNIPTAPFLGWFWEDKQDNTPYVLQFFATISAPGSAQPESGSYSYVSLTLDRIPILDKTPVYPGAESVEQHPVTVAPTSSGDRQITETLITFKTHATRSQVEDYYRTTLAEYNWTYEGKAEDDPLTPYSSGSLVFRWMRGSQGMQGASVALITKDGADGYINVELRLRGTDKYDPWKLWGVLRSLTTMPL
jgi:hypothetical protein